MSLSYLLASVICEQFEKEPGRNQKPLWGGEEKQTTWDTLSGTSTSPRAMLISFKTKIDYDKEEGYRWFDLLIYGPTNYVQVWIRERSNVISLEDMKEVGEGDQVEMVPKKGKDYIETTEEWKMISDHDSCWRDQVRNIIDKHGHTFLVFEDFSSWYKVIPVPPELEKLYEKERNRRTGR